MRPFGIFVWTPLLYRNEWAIFLGNMALTYTRIVVRVFIFNILIPITSFSWNIISGFRSNGFKIFRAGARIGFGVYKGYKDWVLQIPEQIGKRENVQKKLQTKITKIEAENAELLKRNLSRKHLLPFKHKIQKKRETERLKSF